MGLMVGWGGAKLVQTAGDMTTRLGRNLYERTHVETIYLKQDNLYTDGLDAIFQELDEALEMPEELYVASSVQVSFDASGTLTGLYAFLYGADDRGETKSYLFDYNSADSAHVTVWLDGTVNADFAEETRLEPMLALMGKLDLEQEVAGWQSEEYRLLHYGSRSFSAGQENLIVVDDQGGQTAVGEAVQGFEVSLYISGKADAVGRRPPGATSAAGRRWPSAPRCPRHRRPRGTSDRRQLCEPVRQPGVLPDRGVGLAVGGCGRGGRQPGFIG